MYAVDDQQSLERLYDEAENALQFVEPEAFIWAVVGNKADLRPEIEEATAKALSNQIGARLYFYTSAKTGLNVTESMTSLVQTLHRKHTSAGHTQSHSYKGHNVITLPAATDSDTGKTHITSANTPTVSGTKPNCC